MGDAPELLIFGLGYSGQAFARRMTARGWRISATVRDGKTAPGAQPVPIDNPDAMHAAVARALATLITAPPDALGCPGLRALAPALAATGAHPDWIGYLSTTGVYGDRQGGWVNEDSVLAAHSLEGARRAAAEHDWLQTGHDLGLTVALFRLPGLYGPGRSPFDRLREGQARRLIKPGHVFSRIHVDDLAAGLEASLNRPRAGGAYNLCDDEPASAADVTAYAAGLLGMEPPPAEAFDTATISPAAHRFYEECKRVSNARAKAELGWRPRYPTYREGLAAILAEETAARLSSH